MARIRSKNEHVEKELEQWLSVALSTDHDDVLVGDSGGGAGAMSTSHDGYIIVGLWFCIGRFQKE